MDSEDFSPVFYLDLVLDADDVTTLEAGGCRGWDSEGGACPALVTVTLDGVTVGGLQHTLLLSLLVYTVASHLENSKTTELITRG